METPKVYLETTLFNVYFVETRGQYYGKTVRLCQDARRFFEAVEAREFEPYISEYVIEELGETRDTERKAEMMKLVDDRGVIVFPKDDRVEWLADKWRRFPLSTWL